MRFVGLDVSSVATGVAVIEQHPNGSLELLFSDVIVTRSTWHMGKRLLTFAEALQEVFDKYKPDIIVREGSFSNKFIKATQTLFKFNGVAELMTAQYGIAKLPEIAPTSIKKQITGNGKSSKGDVAEALLQYISIDLNDLTEDQTDAIGAVLSYIKLNGVLSTRERIIELEELGNEQIKALKEAMGDE